MSATNSAMSKRAFYFTVLLATLGCVWPSFAAVLGPIATTGHNQDIVFESGLANGQVGANGELGSRQYFENGAGGFADGLPRSVTGYISQAGNAISYDFQPFEQSNILKFETATAAQTLTLTTPNLYSQLAFVFSGGSLATATEVAALPYTINYAGGVTQNGSLNVPDWGAVPALPAGTERFLIADRTTASATAWPITSDNNTTANRWAIYLTEITIARPDLNIDSVTFGPATLNGGPLNAGDDVVVFGLAGAPAVVPEPSTWAFALLGLLAFFGIRRIRN